MKINITAIIAAFILVSCNKSSNDNYTEITVPYKANNTIKASSFIKDFQIVKLDTNLDYLIHQVSKVQYLDDNIYILDIPGNSIYIFNTDGTLEDKVSRMGAGPGEYIQITDFFVENKSLFVLDFGQQSILKYDSDLNYISKTKLNRHSSGFIADKGGFCFYNEPSANNPDYQFSLVTEKGDVVKELLPRNTNNIKFNWAGSNTFTSNNTKQYLSPRYNDTIYNISPEGINPEYVINFGKRKLPNNESINSFDITDPNFNYLTKHNFYTSNKYVIFDYILDKERHFCIYNKDTNATEVGKITNDLIDNFRFFPRWGNDDYLIEEVNPELILHDFNSSPQFREFTTISEDDNPFIIIYKLKT